MQTIMDEITEIADWLRLFIQPGQVTELRALHVSNGYRTNTEFGYFDYDHLGEMCQAAARLSDKSVGVYFVPNPIQPAALARCVNKVKTAREHDLTTDKMIARRTWFLVDSDPVRIDGVSATDDEKREAWLAITAARTLLAQVVNHAIMCDSGNGYHLLCRIEAATEDTATIKGVLSLVADQIDTDRAKIDRKVFNAARIVKCYGTTSRKGDSTPDRPHRLSRVLEVIGEPFAPHCTTADLQAWLAKLGRVCDASGEWVDEHKARTAPQQRRSETSIDRCRRYVAKIDPAISGQGGSNLCFRVACECVLGFNLSIQDAKPIMDEYSTRCQPPWSESEILHKLRDADKRSCERGYRFQARRETQLAPAPEWAEVEIPAPPAPRLSDFPLDIFPPVLADFAVQVAESIGCPVDFVGVTMLTCAAALIGGTRCVSLKRTWQELPRLYVAIVADPGAAKSPAIDAVCKPVYRTQKRWREQYHDARENYEAEQATFDTWKKQGCKAEAPPAPRKPKFKHLYTTDATVEQLATMLADNPRGVLILKDEVTGLVAGMNQYKAGGKGSDRQFYLSAWAGSPIKVDRKKEDAGPVMVSNPHLNIVGGIQPDMLKQLCDAMGREDGFVHRWLFAYPHPVRRKKCNNDDVTNAAELDWDKACARLLCLDTFLVDDGDSQTRKPGRLRMSDKAQVAWEAWYNRHVDEMNVDEMNDALAGPFAKMFGYVGRFMVVIHCLRWACDEADDEIIDEPTVIFATMLGEYFKAHARKVYGVLHANGIDRKAGNIRDWILRHGGQVSARDLVRQNVASIAKTSEAKTFMRDMADRGWGEIEKCQATNGKEVWLFKLAADASGASGICREATRHEAKNPTPI